MEDEEANNGLVVAEGNDEACSWAEVSLEGMEERVEGFSEEVGFMAGLEEDESNGAVGLAVGV